MRLKLDRPPKTAAEVGTLLSTLGETGYAIRRQGNAYCFEGHDTSLWASTRVVTFTLKRLTLRQWVREFERLSGRKVLT